MLKSTAPPVISIVIPAFNAEEYILDTVASALNQLDVAVEVIVVDDGSTDATADLIKGLQGERLRLLQQFNAGEGAARNAGAAVARAPVLGFVDADDLLEPYWAKAVLLGIEAGAHVAVTDAYVFVETERMCRSYYQETAWVERPQQRPQILQRNFVISTAAVRADAFAAAGHYPTASGLRGVADWALWQRIILNGGWIHRTDRVLSGYRRGHGSMSTAVGRMKAAERRLLTSLLQDTRLASSERALVRRGLRRSRGDLYRHQTHVLAVSRPRSAAVSAMATAYCWRNLSYVKTAVLLLFRPHRARTRLTP